MTVSRFTITLLALGSLAMGCATTTTRTSVPLHSSATPAPAVETGFLIRSVAVEGTSHRYTLYLPADYSANKAWPLIVFLHGHGERGDDGIRSSAVGLGHAIRLNPERWPAIVIMPQMPNDVWDNTTMGTFKEHSQREGGPAPDFDALIVPVLEDYNTRIVDAALDATLKSFPIDLDRIYLTGLSMGGYGTWYYAAQHPDQFAAIAPVCGGGRLSDAKAVKNLPIWVFHGADDGVVPPILSQRMVKELENLGADVQYTEFPDTGHNAWDQTYGNPKFARWLLNQHR